ncbi:MAG: hypothetical protein ACXWRE_14525 [Pseudobdellovibrionaceae bacterium]
MSIKTIIKILTDVLLVTCFYLPAYSQPEVISLVEVKTPVKQKQTSKDKYRRTYQLKIKNDNRKRKRVEASLVSVPEAFDIHNLTVSFGDLSPGAIATSRDTITIEVMDKKKLASVPKLHWLIVDHTTPLIKSQNGGILLPGSPKTLIRDATFDYEDNATYKDSEKSIDELGNEFLRTLVSINFDDSATVADVNGVLKKINGKIKSMNEEVSTMSVLIPDPGSIEKLDKLLIFIRMLPKVTGASRAYIPQPDI